MTKTSKNRNQHFISFCLLSALFPFYAFFQMTVLNALAENRMNALHISHAGLSMLSSSYLFGDALLLIPAGLILDRYNARYVILASFASLLISSSIFYFTNSFYLATIARFVAGMAHAFALISCFRLVALYVTNSKQGLVMSLILTIAFLGGFFAQSPFVWLLQTTSFQFASIVQVVIGILIFFILFKIIHFPPFFNENSVDKSNFFLDLKFSIKKSQNSVAAIFIAFMGVPFMTLGALYGIEYLTRYKQLDPIHASLLASLIFVGNIVGTPFSGWLYDHGKFKKILMIAGVLLTLTSFLLMFYTQHLLWLLFFGIGFFSSVQVLGYPIIAASNSKETLGAAMGFANFLIMILLAALQLLTGYLTSFFSLDFSLLWITGLACILSGISVVFF